MEKNLLAVTDLKAHYRTRHGEMIHALDGVSVHIKPGTSLGVAGESGCGKSTLAMALMCYYYQPLEYESGSIVIDGVEITGMKKEELRKSAYGKLMAYIPQAAMNALNPTYKIIHFIEDVMKEHRPELSRKDVLELAKERFETLHLSSDVLNRYAVELSGGMKQRTVIAISTILNPKLLIADEPTSALDVTSQKIVIKLLHDLMDRGYVQSMIFITHELPLLYNVTDHIAVMYAGQIVEQGNAEQMIFKPLHPYSKGLMSSIVVPEAGTRGKRLTSIPGVPPNLKNKLQGCRFADRCTLFKEECRNEDPCLRQAGAGRSYRCTLDENSLEGMKTI